MKEQELELRLLYATLKKNHHTRTTHTHSDVIYLSDGLYLTENGDIVEEECII